MGLSEVIANAFRSDRALHGVDIAYVHGGVELSIRATVGRSGRQVEDSDGFPLKVTYRDYLIAVDDLSIDGEPFEPEEGDVIRETINGQAVSFEVTSEAAGDCWTYSDQSRRDYRVHTQQHTEE